jgi:flagellar basal-body rod protein FlgC
VRFREKAMPLLTVFQLSSQGMTAQRERLEAAASNLANANTTRATGGGIYRRRDVVFETVAIEPAPSSFGLSGSPLPQLATPEDSWSSTPVPSQGVRATTLLAEGEGIKRYEPQHPDADAQGYVTMPEVDPLEETVNMLSAARSFEANATAFSTAKEMMRASLKLGEG